jgi:hypothetical protein
MSSLSAWMFTRKRLRLRFAMARAESIVETKASTLLDFLHGLRGELHVTLEEGTWAAWLYDVLKPHVQEIVVCNPRRNALLKEGSKNDKVDARKLSELLRAGMLRAVYHGEHGLRTLRELARSYPSGTRCLQPQSPQSPRPQAQDEQLPAPSSPCPRSTFAKPSGSLSE